MVAMIKEIKDRPDLHIHKNKNEIMRCCQIDGVLDISLLEAHSKYVWLGENRGIPCDVLAGPCACVAPGTTKKSLNPSNYDLGTDLSHFSRSYIRN